MGNASNPPIFGRYTDYHPQEENTNSTQQLTVTAGNVCKYHVSHLDHIGVIFIRRKSYLFLQFVTILLTPKCPLLKHVLYQNLVAL